MSKVQLSSARGSTSPADEMTDRILAASRERVIAVLPAAVAQAMQTAIPDTYTPELAAQIAQAMIAELQQAAAPGMPIVPALVDGIQVHIPCPTGWCEQDHTGVDAQKFIEDIDHSGAHVDLMSPDMDCMEDRLIGYACLTQDLYSRDGHKRIPYLVFGDTDSEEVPLSLDQAGVFADRLVEFADRIHDLVRTGRQGVTGC
ncbi:DUF6907 domain-containing protein [Streptomyces sp. NY05-11A]|uniref:DUF6907 domain-containing protein n=1 Tax=Streptomyces soliscabiei TaxID=588897 RepID=UPI0029B548A8|nr:hypothetical protein [Streptomyces sp. NY05-11A]MDX2679263.1 hypothetical protein [Streptomyces sp. NY05-11A]